MNKTVGCIALVGVTIVSGCDIGASSKILNFEPNSLKSCDTASEVVVKWDTRNEYPAASNIQILVSDGTNQNLFAEGGAFGEARTGPWVLPGNPKFLLKDKDTGKVLGEATVGGPKCP